jgi:quercetin dioxygenase-like cupin family protein
VRTWNLLEIETPSGSRSPVVLHSDDEARAVLVGLSPGQALGQHQVKEFAYLAVVDGEVTVESGDETVHATSGTLFRFEPDERHSVATQDGARLLLLLAPWPGVGHYRGNEKPRAVSEDPSAAPGSPPV